MSEWNDDIRFAQQIIASQAGNLPAQTRATPIGESYEEHRDISGMRRAVRTLDALIKREDDE